MVMKYFLECEMTLKGDIWLLSREIPFRMIPVLNYIDENLKMLLNKYYEGVRYSAVEFSFFLITIKQLQLFIYKLNLLH